jgi:hypothetical protein
MWPETPPWGTDDMNTVTAIRPPQQYDAPGAPQQPPMVNPQIAGINDASEAGNILLNALNRIQSGLEQMSNPSALVGRLQGKLDRRKVRRQVMEYEWIDCYRRYDGKYDAATLARIKRSAIWLGFTSMKTHTAFAAIMDFLVGNGDIPWDLEPENIPSDLILPMEFLQRNITPDIIREELRKRTEKMKFLMQEQFEECDFETHLNNSILEMCITGTGAIKGPVTVQDESEYFQMILDQNSLSLYPQMVTHRGYKPEYRYVSIFSLYPDMECSNVQKGDGIYEESLLTRAEMVELAKEPDIDASAILATLAEYPYGNAVLDPAKVQLRLLAGDTDPATTNRYAVYHYVGPVTGRELYDAGLPIHQDYWPLEIRAHIVFCGNRLLRARIHKGPIPYHLMPYVKRPGDTPYGKGVPMLCKQTQDAINASARMMLDNSAISSGPLIEANMMLMQPGEDPRDIYAWRVFLSKFDHGTQSTHAITIHQFPNYTDMFIRLINLFRAFMDEESFIPSVTDAQGGVGSNETYGGMALLNANANRSLKNIMRNVDNLGIKPIVQSLVYWNMRFCPDSSVLARVKVKTKGVAAVMAKEQQAQQLMQLTAAFSSFPWFKSIEAGRKIADGLGFRQDQLIATDEELMGMVSPDTEGGTGDTQTAAAIPGRSGGGGAPRNPSRPPVPNSRTKPVRGGLRSVPGGRG